MNTSVSEMKVHFQTDLIRLLKNHDGNFEILNKIERVFMSIEKKSYAGLLNRHFCVMKSKTILHEVPVLSSCGSWYIHVCSKEWGGPPPPPTSEN